MSTERARRQNQHAVAPTWAGRKTAHALVVGVSVAVLRRARRGLEQLEQLRDGRGRDVRGLTRVEQRGELGRVGALARERVGGRTVGRHDLDVALARHGQLRGGERGDRALEQPRHDAREVVDEPGAQLARRIARALRRARRRRGRGDDRAERADRVGGEAEVVVERGRVVPVGARGGARLAPRVQRRARDERVLERLGRRRRRGVVVVRRGVGARPADLDEAGEVLDLVQERRVARRVFVVRRRAAGRDRREQRLRADCARERGVNQRVIERLGRERGGRRRAVVVDGFRVRSGRRLVAERDERLGGRGRARGVVRVLHRRDERRDRVGVRDDRRGVPADRGRGRDRRRERKVAKRREPVHRGAAAALPRELVRGERGPRRVLVGLVERRERARARAAVERDLEPHMTVTRSA